MATERYLERDGDRRLWRILVDGIGALDVLTDDETLRRAREALLDAREHGLLEQPLGTFGPFAVTISATDRTRVAVAVDGPDLGPTFRGNQAIVFYLTHSDLLEALTFDSAAPAV